MRTITKIACRTIGALGLGVAVYDATRVASHMARATANVEEGKHLEKIYFDSRTTDKFSYTAEEAREKVFELRSRNPLHSFFGSIKGGIMGALEGLSNHLITIICSSLAILSRGFMAKVGALGVGVSFVSSVLRNGFGIGKVHPFK